MIVAQLTDTHIRAPGALAYRVVDTAAHLRRAVAHLLALRPRPDVVIATGDLVDVGSAEEYRHLRELLSPLPIPVYLIPGNHDDRAALRSVFADHGYLPADGEFLNYTVDSYPLRLIGLDTQVPGAGGGHRHPPHGRDRPRRRRGHGGGGAAPPAGRARGVRPRPLPDPGALSPARWPAPRQAPRTR
jgi:3',5'-cyclic AMP phosphodiesterase CpdA